MDKPVKPPQPVKPPHPKKPKLIHGIVTVITFAPDMLTVRVRSKATTFPASPDVAVSLNKADAKFGDLLVGDNVFLAVDAASDLVTAIDARRDTPEPTDPNAP